MKNLTVRYSLTQFTFWASSTGAVSFAATYLLSRGLSAGAVGALLAAAGLLSCITQPVLAGIVDRSKHFLLTEMLIRLSVLCVGCMGVLLISNVPIWLAGLCYMSSIWLSDAMVPLTNALCVSYNQAGYQINYGAARGIGAAASAISSLALGHVIAWMGNQWMILMLTAFRFMCIVILLGYPSAEKPTASQETASRGTSVFSFFLTYRWYCASLTGVLFLGMYHAMTENYMIAIMGRLGGNSRHVGMALFISSMAGAPVIFSFQHIRKKMPDTWLLKIAACSFLLKAILLYFAGKIQLVYFIQLLQITSYAFLSPAQVCYARDRVCRTDMVKGQAFSTAAYALGCSGGNFVGGQLLGFGADAILLAGIFMALTGTVIIFLTVTKTDKPGEVTINEAG